MAICQICSKKTVAGRNVSHSEVRTLRKFKANIQKITFFLSGKKVTMNLCTRCIKRLKKDGKMVKLAEKKVSKKVKKDK